MTFHDVRMRGFKRRADVEEVLARLDALPAYDDAERIPLTGAAGRVLAEALVSAVDVPAFARAAMDGWALRGEDTFGAAETDPLTLRVVGTSLPGRPHDGAITAGQAVRIMTGAPLPAGADTVLRAEDGHQDGDDLSVRAPAATGRHVGAPGEDIVAGSTVLPAGRVLRPQDLGVASSIGHGALDVRRAPRVRVLVTGDEVVAPGDALDGARIADANGPMLQALLARDGAAAAPTVYVPDDEAAVRGHLESAAADGLDVLLVTGGSSVGDEDHAPGLVHELGTLDVHGIGLRPAAPTGIGRLPADGGRETVVFLLPGNPVSCLCAYDLFAGRLLRRLGGLDPALPYARRRGTLARKVASVLGRVDYVRVRLEGASVTPVMTSGASILSSTTEADGFLLVPRDLEGYPEDTEVEAFLYDAPRS